MIDFRYHLVSIVAVFLALAVGIVLGNAALNGPVLDGLRGSISRLSGDKRTLEADVRRLEGQASSTDSFAGSVAPVVVANRLRGERLVLVSTPEAPPALAASLTPLLTQAGATVVTEVSVRPALLDPANTTLIDDLVARVVPAGLSLPTGDTATRSGAELAAALASHGGAEGVPAAAAETVLAGFVEGGLLTVNHPVPSPRAATLALVLTGPVTTAPLDPTASARQKAVLALVRGLAGRAKAAVVVGPSGSSTDGSVVTALRDDTTLTDIVSSVDDADTTVGRVLTVMALRQQLLGHAGQYGSGRGATSAVPTLIPG